MPRKARVILPNMPHHIVQRGHNRDVVFVEEQDYQYYLDNLIEWSGKLGLSVLSYCLMTNHVHLIILSNEDRTGISQLMKRLAARQTRHVNRLEKRTGSLWDSRFKISPIETDEYLLRCCRYVELNPVKAKMVASADEYSWSSFLEKIGQSKRGIVDVPSFFAMCELDGDSQTAYEKYVHDFSMAQSDHAFISRAVETNTLTGSSYFIDRVEEKLGLRIEIKNRGRPRKSGSSS